MAVVRPTKRLWRALGGRGALPVVAASAQPVLGDWFACDVVFGRDPVVLFVDRATLFTVFVPLAPVEFLIPSFRNELRHEIERIEIPVELAVPDLAGLDDTTFAKTNDRSVVGYMSVLAGDLDAYGDDRRQRLPADIQAILNRTPHPRRKPVFAEDALRQHYGFSPRR